MLWKGVKLNSRLTFNLCRLEQSSNLKTTTLTPTPKKTTDPLTFAEVIVPEPCQSLSYPEQCSIQRQTLTYPLAKLRQTPKNEKDENENKNNKTQCHLSKIELKLGQLFPNFKQPETKENQPQTH